VDSLNSGDSSSFLGDAMMIMIVKIDVNIFQVNQSQLPNESNKKSLVVNDI
jgi:hypothetical protein